MDPAIAAYNASQPAGDRAICDRLAALIARHLPKASGKVWHGGPVWFLDGNPIAGYWVRKSGVQLLFWSGQSFDEPGLDAVGKFKSAQAVFNDPNQIKSADMRRWLKAAAQIQWDYKNIVKRRGRLEKIGEW